MLAVKGNYLHPITTQFKRVHLLVNPADIDSTCLIVGSGEELMSAAITDQTKPYTTIVNPIAGSRAMK